MSKERQKVLVGSIGESTMKSVCIIILTECQKHTQQKQK
jgi:hypothetical protein